MKVFSKYRKFVLATYDILFINCSFLIALFFRFNTDIPQLYLEHYKNMFLPITVIYLLTFYFFNLYSSLWSLASIDEFLIGGISNIAANSIILIASSFF